MAPFLAELIEAQPQVCDVYAEPFAGGAGAALALLESEHVGKIAINDLNPGIAAFWRASSRQSGELARRIESFTPSVPAWTAQKRIYDNPSGVDDLDLAFATFVLNRCNRSGILHARPIGGLDQTGRWKIDARFNAAELADRVRRIGRYGARIEVMETDAREFVRHIGRSYGPGALMYVDPPYMGQGGTLYMNSLDPSDHEELAVLLKSSPTRWVLTYDIDNRVAELYEAERP